LTSALPPKSLTTAQLLDVEPSANLTDLIWMGRVPAQWAAS
jgi:hypothetical protein